MIYENEQATCRQMSDADLPIVADRAVRLILERRA